MDPRLIEAINSVADPNWTAIVAAVASVVGVMVTAFGLLFVARQLRAAAKVAAADFLLRLEEGYTIQLTATYLKLSTGGDWAPDAKGPQSPAEVAELERYLDYFATLQMLRSQGIISLETIDQMFAYRFFVAANSPHAKRILEPKRAFWHYLYVLYSDWSALRKGQKQDIPQMAHALV